MGAPAQEIAKKFAASTIDRLVSANRQGIEGVILVIRDEGTGNRFGGRRLKMLYGQGINRLASQFQHQVMPSPGQFDLTASLPASALIEKRYSRSKEHHKGNHGS